jgi:hypothetical protein
MLKVERPLGACCRIRAEATLHQNIAAFSGSGTLYVDIRRQDFGLCNRLLGGGDADDTALNAIRLKCRSIDENIDERVIKSSEGEWGTWGGWRECPSGEYLYGYRIKVEPEQGDGVSDGEDDTAANDIEFGCRAHAVSNKQRVSDFMNAGNGGAWGMMVIRYFALLRACCRIEP